MRSFIRVRRARRLGSEYEGVRDDAGRYRYHDGVGPGAQVDPRHREIGVAPPARREQPPVHDDGETIATIWINPANALRAHAAGDLEMIFPTIKNLEAISRFETAGELLAAAAAIDNVVTILPRIINDADGMRIVLPGDPGYDQVMDGTGA